MLYFQNRVSATPGSAVASEHPVSNLDHDTQLALADRINLFQLGHAIAEYRKKRGTLPDTLDALKEDPDANVWLKPWNGGLPRDPVYGKPTHSRSRRARVRISKLTIPGVSA